MQKLTFYLRNFKYHNTQHINNHMIILKLIIETLTNRSHENSTQFRQSFFKSIVYTPRSGMYLFVKSYNNSYTLSI